MSNMNKIKFVIFIQAYIKRTIAYICIFYEYIILRYNINSYY